MRDPLILGGRGALEDSWRQRLQEARARYSEATGRYRKLLRQQPDGVPPELDANIAAARQAESKALAEYARVLRIFTELTVSGNIPKNESAGESDCI
jgi:hypothetical protein